MIALAKAVPLWAWAVIALIALLGGALIFQTLALADARAEHASYIARVEKAARDAMDAARREESRRQQVINEVRNDARAQIKNADDDAAVAVATADSLQHRIDQLLADRAACRTRIARGSETIRDLTVVLADLRRRADERAGELARIADASRIAGQACERAYDGLVRSSR